MQIATLTLGPLYIEYDFGTQEMVLKLDGADVALTDFEAKKLRNFLNAHVQGAYEKK